MKLEESKKKSIHKETPQKKKWEKPDVFELSYENTSAGGGQFTDGAGRIS